MGISQGRLGQNRLRLSKHEQEQAGAKINVSLWSGCLCTDAEETRGAAADENSRRTNAQHTQTGPTMTTDYKTYLTVSVDCAFLSVDRLVFLAVSCSHFCAINFSTPFVTITIMIVMPAPNRRGIKRCFCLTSVCLTSLCREHRA